MTESDFERADALLLLGVLHEAIIALTDERNEQFWAAICSHVRWLVPARRVCAYAFDGPSVAVAFERGRSVTPPESDGVHDFIAHAASFKAPRWLDAPFEAQFSDTPLGEWLLETDPKSVLVTPVRTRTRKWGALAFSIQTELSDTDRTLITGLVGLYGLYAGMSFSSGPETSDGG